jgi:hypothetical protein
MERSLCVVRNSRCAKTLAQDRFWHFIKQYQEEVVQMLEA